VAVLTAVAFTTAGSSPSARSVTTVGHGDVTVVPDQATVSAGVRSSAATAAGALAENSTAMSKVIAALKAVGVRKLQTQQVSLYPQTNAKDHVTGFVAQNTVSATSAVADAGKLIDAAVGAGANTVDGPFLAVASQAALYRAALAKAVADARSKAVAIARAGRFGVGRVVSVTEQSAQQPIVFQAASAGAKSAPGTPAPVEAGTQDVTADVQVSFAIR
jgi:uncharacterized protein YggE